MLNKLRSMNLQDSGFAASHFDSPRIRFVIDGRLFPKNITGFQVTEHCVPLVLLERLVMLLWRNKHSSSARVQQVNVVVLLLKLCELIASTRLILQPENFKFFQHTSTDVSELRSEPHQEINFGLGDSCLFLLQELVVAVGLEWNQGDWACLCNRKIVSLLCWWIF